MFRTRMIAFWQCRHGVAAVEFAFVGTLLMVGFLSLIEYSSYVRDRRAVATLAAVAAETIADSGETTVDSRDQLQHIAVLVNAQASSMMKLAVYHVTTNAGMISLQDKWSTTQNDTSAPKSDWQIIGPYLTNNEGGVVACANLQHSSLFVSALQATIKSCSVGVSPAVADIDWR